VKKILYSLIALFALIGLALYFVSKNSDSYVLAVNELYKSESNLKSIGVAKQSLLMHSRHKLKPNDTSCGNFVFFVNGTKGFGIVEVLVRKKNFHVEWEIYDVLEGVNSTSEKSCKSKRSSG
jgi:uncharacterized membrane protein